MTMLLRITAFIMIRDYRYFALFCSESLIGTATHRQRVLQPTHNTVLVFGTACAGIGQEALILVSVL